MTASTSAPERATVQLVASLAANEAGKGLRLMWRRRTMLLVVIGMDALTYLGISLFIGGGHLVKPLMVRTLPALLAWVLAGTTALQGSGDIAEEINGGTLEQAQLSPAPPAVQILGRIAALAVEGLLIAAVLGVLFVAGLHLDYQPHPAVLVAAVLTLADALGYAMLITALTVRVAAIGAITHVFGMVIMVFGGTLVPVAVFPHGLQTLARFIPTTLGVEAINHALAGQPHGAVWADGTLVWLLAHAVVLLGAGLLTYVFAIRRARREGGLSPR